jgi:hypothetical protein
MDLFANLVANASAIAQKSGLSVAQIEAISTSLQSQLRDGCDHDEAVEAAAAQNTVSMDKIEEVLNHAGSSGDLLTDVGGLFGGLIRRPPPD